MSTPDVPLIDIGAWRTGGTEQRRRMAVRMDAALADSGFLMVADHGFSADLMARIRSSAGRFFGLPAATKAIYSTSVGGRGWLPPGGEANAFYGEVADATRADLKESLTMGRDFQTGDPAIDEVWFVPNVWPTQTPELAELCAEFTDQARALYRDLLQIGAVALGLPPDWFAQRCQNSPHTFNINRYPPRSQTGAPLEGQFRVAPHTDWGILTILDRQPGYGGLQIQTRDGDWADAPYVPGALTINVGDLLARWTGERWRSTRHRVLPPPAEAPDEELISLIVFLEAEVDTVIEAVNGAGSDEPVIAGEYLIERATAATVA